MSAIERLLTVLRHDADAGQKYTRLELDPEFFGELRDELIELQTHRPRPSYLGEPEPRPDPSLMNRFIFHGPIGPVEVVPKVGGRS